MSNNNFNFQTGDFNGDGKTDLIHFVNDGKKGFVTVWNSKGDGTFDVKAPFTPSPNYDVSNNNFNFKLGDFNGDRKTDLIHFVNDGKKGYVHVWLSKGDGTFDLKSAFTPNPSYDVTNNNFNFKLGDFDGDGKTDLIHLINGGNGYVNVWNSKGDGTFDVTPAFSPNPSYDVTNNNFNFKLGDFDGDGKTDLTHFVNGGNGYVNVWNSNGDSTATIKKEANDALQDLRNKYFPELNQANTLTNLQTQVNKEVDQSQQQFASLQASITQKQAQAAAANSQAIWYDQEAALHYQISHKSGATWTEERKEKSRSGGSKTIVVTHVDHDWIIYDAYTQQAASLREQAVKLLKGAEADTTQQNTVSEILKQWQATSSIANQAATTQDQLIALLNQDQAKLQLNGDKQQQIADWQKLLSVLQPQLDQAVKTAESDKAQVAKNWTDYTLSQQAEQKALADLTPKRIDLEAQGQQLLQEINETKQWVTQQSNLLQDEIDQSEALVTQLKTQREAIVKQLVSATGHNKNTLLSLQTLLDQNINLLGQKEAVLIAQQTSFVQKQTLLSTQKQLIETQYQLLDIYIASPDKDTSSLEKLLTDTRASLADAQKLAQQAEASSTALTAIMDDVQASLLLQTDKYLSAIRDKDKKLEEILAESKIQENLTLQATQKQIEINALSPKIEEVLKRAVDAGNKQVTKLLEAVHNNDFATSTEIIYRDYSDLGGDKGNWCVKGLARPEDRVIAGDAYNKMLAYRDLKAKADEQAAKFGELRTLAESQLAVLKTQEGLAKTELTDLRQSIGDSQDKLKAKQEELAIAQFRTDALSQIRSWTEQTINQVLVLETSNLAQAQSEQAIAKNRSTVIDQALNTKLEKERGIINRDRDIAVAQLQQLAQIKTEEALQTAINGLRNNLGISPIDNIIQKAEQNGQLAGILADIEAFQKQQPTLSDSTKTLLNSTIQDIHTALQGKETKTIQDNLLKTATALIDQSNTLKIEVAKIQQEEQRYLDLLTQSQTDLKGATKTLYDEIQKSGVLDSEKTLLNAKNLEVLYKIGYAQGAMDLSSTLAKQSKDILEQVITGRIEERNLRKKALFNEIFGAITLVISAVAAVLTAGASLAVNAAAAGILSGVSATTISTISSIANVLRAVSASLSAVQAAYNGDLSGAIFNAGIAALGFASVSGAKLPTSFQFGDVKTFQDVQKVASSAYYAYKAGTSGDGLSSMLNIISAALPLTKFSDYNYLSEAALSIQSGVQLAKEGDWLAATSNFLSGAFSIGSEFDGSFGLDFTTGGKIIFNQFTYIELLKVISMVEGITDTVSGIKNIINNDGFKGWLTGIQDISSTVSNYLSQGSVIDTLTDRTKQLFKNSEHPMQIPNRDTLTDAQKVEFDKLIAKNGKKNVLIDKEGKLYSIHEISGKNDLALIALGDIDKTKPTILITYGYRSYMTPEWAYKLAQETALKNPNANVIIGDWSEIVQDINYFAGASGTKIAGEAMATKLKDLGIKFEQLTIIGHSLGAQVAAHIAEFAQKNNYGKVDTIIGLDPSRPSFEKSFLVLIPNLNNQGRLTSDDATNVITIRSEINSPFALGYQKNSATNGMDIVLPTSNPLAILQAHSNPYKFLIDALQNKELGITFNSSAMLNNAEKLRKYVPTWQNIQKPDNTKPTPSDTLSNVKNSSQEENSSLKQYGLSSGLSFGASDNTTQQLTPIDPLVIDLDGDGVKVNDVKNSSIFFDMDNDGYAENTAWVSPFDGILATDVNHDGTINNISEIFSEYYSQNSSQSGLQALASFDSNKNGIISASDSRFNEILVWQDLNQNGVSEPDELKTLSQHGLVVQKTHGSLKMRQW